LKSINEADLKRALTAKLAILKSSKKFKFSNFFIIFF